MAIYQSSFEEIQLADRKERVTAMQDLYDKIPDIRVVLTIWYHMGPKSSISTAAEIRPVSLHTLRKTGASLLESLGVSRAETQVALPHKRPSVTDIYASVYMEQRREYIEQLADLRIDEPIPYSTLKVG